MLLSSRTGHVTSVVLFAAFASHFHSGTESRDFPIIESQTRVLFRKPLTSAITRSFFGPSGNATPSPRW